MDKQQLQEACNKVEATLFASGDRMTADQISKAARMPDLELIRSALKELEQIYNAKDSSLHLVSDGDSWKFHVRPKYLSIAKRMGVKAEITKTVIETLAVVAWKAPVKQSEIIDIRTNKAYDHLSELEKAGFITRQKYGRTKMIKLGQKFFEYFELDEQTMKKLIDRTADKAREMEVKLKEEKTFEEEPLTAEKVKAVPAVEVSSADVPGSLAETIIDGPEEQEELEDDNTLSETEVESKQ
ncbi:MAG: SMC-Scp complex subunit ScpB [Nanoarchaeota archaeon]